MNKIIKGSKIKSDKFNTIHVVEHIETISNVTLVYTEDIKCFPLNEVSNLDIMSKVTSFFKKLINKEKVREEERNLALEELRPLLKITPIMSFEDFMKMEDEKSQAALPPGN